MNEAHRWSQSVEDYLKTIYDLAQSQEPISTNQIAAQMNVSPASVTSMLKKLSAQDPPLVHYTRHYGAYLTERGQEIALRTIRRHRLLEQFLLDYLGYSWDEIHEEAERLEHAVSERFEKRLADRLGQPGFDPHGDPIPAADLSLPESSMIPLNQLRAGQSATVRRVHSSNAGLLRYLGERGIRPDARLKMVEQGTYDQTMRILVNGQGEMQVLGGDLGGLILVETG
ncbi:MAG TPA: metal-dependent transcriptional regulator [Levilinea sp.]|nr:metal-dependent transcriptional regulator [Levilinea sp.]